MSRKVGRVPKEEIEEWDRKEWEKENDLQEKVSSQTLHKRVDRSGIAYDRERNDDCVDS